MVKSYYFLIQESSTPKNVFFRRRSFCYAHYALHPNFELYCNIPLSISPSPRPLLIIFSITSSTFVVPSKDTYNLLLSSCFVHFNTTCYAVSLLPQYGQPAFPDFPISLRYTLEIIFLVQDATVMTCLLPRRP